jgi:hypothetical protein
MDEDDEDYGMIILKVVNEKGKMFWRPLTTTRKWKPFTTHLWSSSSATRRRRAETVRTRIYQVLPR